MEAPRTHVACPACDGTMLRQRARIGADHDQTVLLCETCNLEFLTAFQTGSHSAHSAVTDDGYIDEMLKGYADAASLLAMRAKLRLEQYTRLLGRRPERILEVGSGPGWMIKAYRNQGIDALGLELDERLVAAVVQGANVRQGDICTIDTETLGAFDVVCSSQTLEHILTPVLALQQMRKVLKPAGVMHIDVPNGNSWGARVRRIRHDQNSWGAISLPHHQVSYAPRSLAMLLERVGMEVRSVQERPTNDRCHGQAILPRNLRSKVFIAASRVLGHGYLLVALATKRPVSDHDLTR